MAVRKRCIRCRKYVRDDGTCQNPNCVLYVPEENTENTVKPDKTKENGTFENA